MGDSTFLTQFLQLSTPQTLIFILVLVGIFIGIKQSEKKKVKFSKRMIGSMLVGIILGVVIQWVAGFPENPGDIVWINELSSWYGLVGNGFMDLLKMLVVPLVFLSIVRVIMNMKGDKLGKLTAKTIGMLLGTTVIAALVGVIVANLFGLGVGDVLPEGEVTLREMDSIVDTFRGLIPANPVKSMADSNIIAVVIFAAFIGTSIRRLTKKHLEVIDPFIKWVEAFYKIIVSVAMTVIKFMPYAVVALLANTISGRGISALTAVFDFIIATYVGLAIVFVLHLIIAVLNGVNPIKYLQKASEPLILAFTSRSSLGTLPLTVEVLEQKVGVDEGTASFVTSLGANMGMNGCAGVYPAIMTVMLATMTGMTMDLGFYIMLVIIIAISSLGIAGIPGSATIAVSVVISGMGLGAYFPLVGAIIAIDPILDMGRTMINVSGTMITALTVAKTEGKLDKEILNKQ